MRKKNVLWVSYCVPYDKVAHAGGQIHNYYLKQLNATGEYNIDLISFAKQEDLNKIDLNKYGINNQIIMHYDKSIQNIQWMIMYRIRKYNPFSSYGVLLTPYIEYKIENDLLQTLKKGKYKPDIIILQWTQIVLFADKIIDIFPDVPVICIEEDVAFLSSERQYKREINPIVKYIFKKQYLRLKEKEIFELSLADEVILNNPKDLELLNSNGLMSKKWFWSPYFNSMFENEYVGDKNDVLFYGAMNRPENWKSVIWFIENVWNKITHINARLLVVGNKPSSQLLKYASDNVVITGFVDDPNPYFMHSKCMVAPLLYGAGIKIKVLEGLSSGVPVLTNSIGIEGIPAKNNIEYFHCETANDYIETINKIFNNEVDLFSVSRNAKLFIQKNYNYKNSLKEFDRHIKELINHTKKTK